MCRYVLIAVVVAIVLLMVVAGIVVSLYGWTGFLVLLAALVVLATVLLTLGPRLFPRFLMGTLMRPMRQMGKVLRGARLTVHSVTPAERPETPDEEDGGDDEPHRIRDREADDEPDHSHRLHRRDQDDEDEEGEDDEEFVDDEEPSPENLDWYWIDFTVTPRDAGSSEGRMVNRTAWNPGLLSFFVPKADRPRAPSGMPAFFEQFAPGQVLMNELEAWDGTDVEEESAEVFGEARFRARVGVGRKIGTLLLVYAHFTEVGEIRIPRIDATPGRES